MTKNGKLLGALQEIVYQKEISVYLSDFSCCLVINGLIDWNVTLTFDPLSGRFVCEGTDDVAESWERLVDRSALF